MSMTIEVRRFTAQGNDEFATLIRHKDADLLDRIDDLLRRKGCTESVSDQSGSPVQVEIKFIERRLELARHLWEIFGHGKPLAHVAGDALVWNWLSASFLRCLVEDSVASREAVLGREEARWLLTSDVLRYHRHLISGPFFALEGNHEHPERAMCLLATSVVAPGEVVERIAGKRSLAIGSVCHLATCLYFDPEAGVLRRGHTSNPGNPKAFSYYFSQLDVNVDYLGMDVDALLDILPANFEHWVRLAKSERVRGLA